jgi:CspA family cold shock protein
MRLLPAAITLSSLASTLAFVPSTPLSSLRSASSLSRLFSATSDVTGTVKWYNAERGFGFIAIDDGGADMYVHATGLTFDGPLIENERVGFTTEIDARTNKPKAVAVVRVGEEEDVVNTEAEEESDAVAAAVKMNEEEDRTKKAEAKV